MGIILSIMIILLMLWILGTDIHIIIGIVLGLLGLLTAVTLLFFAGCVISLIGSKKKQAVFSRIDKSPMSKFRCAYYIIDGEEYPNAFPAEVAFHRQLYREDSEVTVHITRRGKFVYDRNAFITVYAGFAVFLLMTAAAALLAGAMIV